MSEIEIRSLILDHPQVVQKIRRIAFEVFENNFKEKSIVLAGIDGQGYVLAKMLGTVIEEIAPIQIDLVKVSLKKEDPTQGQITLDVEPKIFKKKVIVLIDDVLNSGRTLAYGMKPFLEVEIKKIEVAVLVNRSHPKFPIQPTYTGYELATTLSDHVEVTLGKKSSVYLK
jgi:pyrimidine operon attenuation protein/uracil phosphoribosyltransferase